MSQYIVPTRPKSAPPRNENMVAKRHDQGLPISAEPTLQYNLAGPQSAVPSAVADKPSAESGDDRGPTPTKFLTAPCKDAEESATTSEIRHIASSENIHSSKADTMGKPLAVGDGVSQNVQSGPDKCSPNCCKMAQMPPGSVHGPCAASACTFNAQKLPRELARATGDLKSSVLASASCHTGLEDLFESVDVEIVHSDKSSATLDALSAGAAGEARHDSQNKAAKARRYTTQPANLSKLRVKFVNEKDAHPWLVKDTDRISWNLLANHWDQNNWKCSCTDRFTIKFGKKNLVPTASVPRGANLL